MYINITIVRKARGGKFRPIIALAIASGSSETVIKRLKTIAPMIIKNIIAVVRIASTKEDRNSLILESISGHVELRGAGRKDPVTVRVIVYFVVLQRGS